MGIGVDYGIYIFSRMRSFMQEGLSLDESYLRTLRLTGKAVFFTAVTLAVGVGTWLFSALQFQARYGRTAGLHVHLQHDRRNAAAAGAGAPPAGLERTCYGWRMIGAEGIRRSG